MKAQQTSLMSQSICIAVIFALLLSIGEARNVYEFISHQDKRDCEIYQNEALHAVLDKLCGDCHELFRHEVPDLHAKCRRNCFENKVFQMCWQAINPGYEQGGLTSAADRK